MKTCHISSIVKPWPTIAYISLVKRLPIIGSGDLPCYADQGNEKQMSCDDQSIIQQMPQVTHLFYPSSLFFSRPPYFFK